jgi:O-antigen ligase
MMLLRNSESEWSTPMGCRLSSDVVKSENTISRLVSEGFAVISLVMFSIGGIPFAARPAEGSVAPSASQTFFLILLSIYAVSIVSYSRHIRSVIRLGPNRLLCGVLLALAFASLYWSQSPNATLNQLVALLGTTAFGLFFVSEFDKEEKIRILLVMCAVVCSLCLLVAVTNPSYATDSSGALRGVFVHKNTLGRFMALSAWTSLLCLVYRGPNRFLCFFNSMASIYLLTQASSGTANVALFVMVVIIPVFALFWLHRTLAIPAIALVSFVGGYFCLRAWESSSEILSALGKDPTLTGRTELWDKVWDAIQQRPALGFGYGAFWTGFEGPSAEIWRTVPWHPPHAHMGFLDLWLDLGVIGVGAFVLLMVSVLVYSARLAWRAPNVYSFWVLAYLVFFTLNNLSESMILKANSMYWVLFVAIALSLDTSLGRAAREDRSDSDLPTLRKPLLTNVESDPPHILESR